MFVDDFLGLVQGPRHRRRHVRRTFFHALDKIFHPLDSTDIEERKEVLSLKNLDAGDCSWSTCKLLLGWVVDTINIMISLPPHRADRFRDILAEIPATQKRISVNKWHLCLSELRSMLLALPGSRGLFSQMQEALSHVKGKWVTLTRDMHGLLAGFQWLAEDMASLPTRLFKLVPLTPSLDGYQKSSGRMCGGVVLPGPSSAPPYPAVASQR